MTLIGSNRPVVLVGAGKMGGAMLAGWLADGRPSDHFAVIDPHLGDDMAALLSRHNVSHEKAIPAGLQPSVVIIAVKPQMMGVVLPTLSSFIACNPVFVSVAAGTSVATFEDVLGHGTAIVRAMPNTPAQVGRGITIGYANNNVEADQKKAVSELLVVTGDFDWVDQEKLIDAVTALSGSGPAYVFHLVEAMAIAGERAGLSPDLSLRLARATVEGAGELLYQSDLQASTLRENVTSPGGTTAAALSVLMREEGLSKLMTEAVLAAKSRAEALGE